MDSESFEHLEQLLREDTKSEFEIHKMLGRGGMAVVYLATEIHLRRKVAIKVLPPELTFGHGVDRFKREAQTAAALDHPHIIPVYRIASGRKLFWYAMKFLEGRSLEDLIKEKKRLSLDETIYILSQVAEALDYAHEHSVIHRDVKPANVMLDSRNRVIVTDFGIAKALTEQTLTASGSVVGTPYYMSPEQGVGKGVSGRSDQYSVAVMAYRMLSGQVPFEGDSAIDILHKHVMEPPPPLQGVAPSLPPHVYFAIHQALEKKQDARFPSVTALVNALRGAAPADAGAGREAATVALPASQASVAARSAAQLPTTKRPVQPAAAPKPTPKPAARPGAAAWKKAAMILGLAAVAGAGLGAWLLSRQQPKPLGEETQPRRDSVVAAAPAAAPTTAESLQTGAPPTATPSQPQEARAQTPAAAQPTGTQPGTTRGTPTRTAAPAGGTRDTSRTPARPTQQPTRQPPPAAQPRTPPPAATPVTTPATDPTDLPSQPGMGLVVLRDAPIPHRLFVDGRPQLRPRVELPPGSHQLRVTAPNRSEFNTTVNVVAGQRTLVVYGVQAAAAGPMPTRPPPTQEPAAQPAGPQVSILQLRVNPWANITINGASKGARPLLVDTLISGTHLLHFEREGFETKDTTITLRPGETLRLVILMVQKP
ncbi:MAG: protein kinase [Gemmatimonadetes bacterium]|nr:protein kinase [Gemmatimonadota bacterium]